MEIYGIIPPSRNKSHKNNMFQVLGSTRQKLPPGINGIGADRPNPTHIFGYAHLDETVFLLSGFYNPANRPVERLDKFLMYYKDGEIKPNYLEGNSFVGIEYSPLNSGPVIMQCFPQFMHNEPPLSVIALSNNLELPSQAKWWLQDGYMVTMMLMPPTVTDYVITSFDQRFGLTKIYQDENNPERKSATVFIKTYIDQGVDFKNGFIAHNRGICGPVSYAWPLRPDYLREGVVNIPKQPHQLPEVKKKPRSFILYALAALIGLGMGTAPIISKYFSEPEQKNTPVATTQYAQTRPSSTPLPTATPTIIPTPTEVPIPTSTPVLAQCLVRNTGGLGINVRKEPSLDAPIEIALPDRTRINLKSAVPTNGFVEVVGGHGWIYADVCESIKPLP